MVLQSKYRRVQILVWVTLVVYSFFQISIGLIDSDIELIFYSVVLFSFSIVSFMWSYSYRVVLGVDRVSQIVFGYEFSIFYDEISKIFIYEGFYEIYKSRFVKIRIAKDYLLKDEAMLEIFRNVKSGIPEIVYGRSCNLDSISEPLRHVLEQKRND